MPHDRPDDHDVLILVAQQVKEIHSAINGSNGQPGLQQRTESLERWRSYIAGALAVLTMLAGWAVAAGVVKH